MATSLMCKRWTRGPALAHNEALAAFNAMRVLDSS